MSKASEWAVKLSGVHDARPASLGDVRNSSTEYLRGWVEGDGRAQIRLGSQDWYLTPEAALALGRWLIDTFGEQP